ncbi:MAG: hypothetical protein CMJ18_20235 [Phycisphaeraceae bacterium]|nr:hypothetical protein [Phycisphaeraceae bacterium]
MTVFHCLRASRNRGGEPTRQFPHHLVGPALALTVLSLGACQMSGQNPIKGSLGEVLDPFYQPSPAQLARDAFDISDADKRRRAVALLSSADWGGEDVYLETYRLAARTDPDDSVRAVALSALGRHGNVDDVPLIISSLKHGSLNVRWASARALQKIHNPKAISPLIKAATDDEVSDVRVAAVKALGQYARPSVFDALVGALNDTDYSVSYNAWQSLQTLTGETLPMDARPWLAWSKENGGELFANRQAYIWQPYDRPPGLLDKVQFWKDADPVPPRAPTGFEPTRDEELGA